MGNRAVITTSERKVGVYLHWNGGRDTIEPLLKYCELQGYRPPSSDEYGFARICQVMGNFFGGSLSLGVGAYTTDRQMDPGDNGIYVIEGWRIADHLRTEYDSDWNPVGMRSFGPSEEEDWHKFDDMLRAFDASMPEELRLGELLDSVEVPASELQVGDEVWMYDSVRGKWEPSRSSASGNRTATASQWRSMLRTAGRRSSTLTCRTSPITTTTATSRGTATTTSTATWPASAHELSRPQPERSQFHRSPSATRSAGFLFASLALACEKPLS